MNIEKLKIASAFLRTIPEEAVNEGKFDIMDWMKDKYIYTEKNMPKFDGTFSCGFAGCAMGWIAHAQIFPGELPTPMKIDWVHITNLFDISYDLARGVFSYISYGKGAFAVTPEMVADRIDMIIIHEESHKLIKLILLLKGSLFSKDDWESFAGAESEDPHIAAIGEEGYIIADGDKLEIGFIDGTTTVLNHYNSYDTREDT